MQYIGIHNNFIHASLFKMTVYSWCISKDSDIEIRDSFHYNYLIDVYCKLKVQKKF